MDDEEVPPSSESIARSREGSRGAGGAMEGRSDAELRRRRETWKAAKKAATRLRQEYSEVFHTRRREADERAKAGIPYSKDENVAR